MGLPVERQDQNETDARPSVHASSAVIMLLRVNPDIFYLWIQLYFVLKTSVWGDKVPL